MYLLRADLTGADLGGADLAGANLTGANLTFYAELGNAHLTGAHLTGAHLGGANLTGADLDKAYLDDASNLRGAKLGPDPRWVPPGWIVTDPKTGRTGGPAGFLSGRLADRRDLPRSPQHGIAPAPSS